MTAFLISYLATTFLLSGNIKWFHYNYMGLSGRLLYGDVFMKKYCLNDMAVLVMISRFYAIVISQAVLRRNLSGKRVMLVTLNVCGLDDISPSAYSSLPRS